MVTDDRQGTCDFHFAFLVRRNGRTSTAAPLPATGRSTQRNAPSGQSLPTNFKALPLQFMTLGNVVYIIKKCSL